VSHKFFYKKYVTFEKRMYFEALNILSRNSPKENLKGGKR